MVSCPRCAGKREIKVIERTTCEWCNGSGYAQAQVGPNKYDTCRICNGRGIVIVDMDRFIPCHYCADTVINLEI